MKKESAGCCGSACAAVAPMAVIAPAPVGDVAAGIGNGATSATGATTVLGTSATGATVAVAVVIGAGNGMEGPTMGATTGAGTVVVVAGIWPLGNVVAGPTTGATATSGSSAGSNPSESLTVTGNSGLASSRIRAEVAQPMNDFLLKPSCTINSTIYVTVIAIIWLLPSSELATYIPLALPITGEPENEFSTKSTSIAVTVPNSKSWSVALAGKGIAMPGKVSKNVTVWCSWGWLGDGSPSFRAEIEWLMNVKSKRNQTVERLEGNLSKAMGIQLGKRLLLTESPLEFDPVHLQFFAANPEAKLGTAHIDLHQSHPTKTMHNLVVQFQQVVFPGTGTKQEGYHPLVSCAEAQGISHLSRTDKYEYIQLKMIFWARIAGSLLYQQLEESHTPYHGN
ncbi:hypothetical protein RJ639_020896 [Escallonia herrerae]|uniref:Uncharacterized protein n=1 Tax=Escallonia herrerae TaxID=1293975 RepID=A0AA88V6N4_9ASTE|nr:hypothetical protein RJ639_020896 [Escallonia herrerae]